MERAERIAGYLHCRNIAHGDLIGLCIERSTGLMAAMLGILMAGGAYLPLDPMDPAERLEFLLSDAHPRIVVATSALAKRLPTVIPDHAYELALIDQIPDGVVPLSAMASVGRLGSDDLVYVIYTSGSTGRPKGVSMTHRSAENLIAWRVRNSVANHANASNKAATGAAVRVLQYTPLTFDVSFLEIFSSLCAGGMLVVPSDAERRDLGALLDLVVVRGIGSLFLPFTVLNQLAELAVRRGVYPATLFEIMTGGEQLRITPAITSWFSGMPQCMLQNIYGPTEAHVVTTHNLTGDPHRWPDLPPIGRPIQNVDIHILDESLQPVFAGASGEICIGGISLARGYLNRPDLTVDSFVPNPFGIERLYRTGDLGHILTDGSIMYDGRRDEQVKIQGVRIELGEIEMVLEQHPDVRQCAVLALEDVPGSRRLVAYIVPKSGAQLTRQVDPRWHDFLAKRLPETVVPRTYVMLASLPLTSSGKVDRRALPAPSTQRPIHVPAVAPSSPLERTIAGIWQEYLQIEEVGIDDGFFELGGQSLLLVQVQNRLSAVLGREVPVIALLQNPSIRALAAHLDRTPLPVLADRVDTAAARRGRRDREVARRQHSRTPLVALDQAEQE